MHLGVNLRLAKISGIEHFYIQVQLTLTIKAVYQVVKLVGHVGTPEYAHGVQTFPDYLEMKASDPQFPNSTYYKNVMNKLGRQIGSRYYVTAKMPVACTFSLSKLESA